MFVEEYNYYQMGVLPSYFYSALTGRDSAAFKEILWRMSIMVISVCIVSAVSFKVLAICASSEKICKR